MIGSLIKHLKKPQYHTRKVKTLREGLLITIGIIIIIVAGLSERGSTPSPSIMSNASGLRPSIAVIGQTIKGNTLSATVTNVEITQTIGKSKDEKTARGMFYSITLKIRNDGNKTRSIPASDFTVLDSQGKTYGSQTEDKVTGNLTDLNSLPLKPHMDVIRAFVFDVPKDATGIKLILKGDLLGSPVSINL